MEVEEKEVLIEWAIKELGYNHDDAKRKIDEAISKGYKTKEDVEGYLYEL